MKQITYTVTDPLGIHARPAGLLVKKAKELSCEVLLTKADKQVDACKLFAVMGLRVKQNDEITFSISGETEQAAADEMLRFLQQNL